MCYSLQASGACVRALFQSLQPVQVGSPAGVWPGGAGERGTFSSLAHCSRIWIAGSPRGGAGRDRTGDLPNAIQALSQLSYGPTREAQANPTHRVLSKVTFQPTYGRKTNRAWGMLEVPAGVVKLVYAGDSKSPGRKAVRVRFPPPAP